MAPLGRTLQVIGLAGPPVLIVLQILPRNAQGDTVLTLGQMLVGLVALVSLFYIGRILEAYGRR